MTKTYSLAPSGSTLARPLPAAARGRRLGVLGLVLAGLVLAACDGEPPPVAPPAADATAARAPVTAAATTIALAEVKSLPMRSSIAGTGSVVAWEELPIASEIGGLTLVEVPVEEGQAVKAGDVLARLNDRVLRAQTAQQAAQINEAKAMLAEAQSNLSRGQELRRREVVSAQSLEQRQTNAQTAQARVALAEAARREMEARLNQTVIRAPTDGYVSRRMAVLGRVVQPGEELFRIVRDGVLELDVEVPENDLARVQAGQPVVVRHGSGVEVAATVRSVEPTVDAKTRLGIVHVRLPAGQPLKIGMFATAEIRLADGLVAAVPEAALIWRDGRPGVYIVEDGRARFVDVETGVRQGGMVEIRSGVAQGARVIATGAGFLSDGERITVAPDGVPMAAAPAAQPPAATP
ncbi:efflux RND transporter periplasmic adaptor subunit [Zavarzinia sp. CC-PAN008]|uniref:efflux RND transporter periplasmic adaptor subunit n=1 Tax=Zavarzinia sp. CC-PAN008 TaxID=3243332 RepID=UPI003F749702